MFLVVSGEGPTDCMSMDRMEVGTQSFRLCRDMVDQQTTGVGLIARESTQISPVTIRGHHLDTAGSQESCNGEAERFPWHPRLVAPPPLDEAPREVSMVSSFA